MEWKERSSVAMLRPVEYRSGQWMDSMNLLRSRWNSSERAASALILLTL